MVKSNNERTNTNLGVILVGNPGLPLNLEPTIGYIKKNILLVKKCAQIIEEEQTGLPPLIWNKSIKEICFHLGYTMFRPMLQNVGWTQQC